MAEEGKKTLILSNTMLVYLCMDVDDWFVRHTRGKVKQ